MVKSADNRTASVPPFLNKCYEMVDDESTDSIISWSDTDNSFIIWDITEFSVKLLPNYFKTTNFSSFIRQLNIYGFRKTDTDRWEFANDGFIRGQKHLLKNICRRKHSQGPDHRKSSQQKDNPDIACEEIENLGLWKEVENLKTDKNALMQELVKLRQHQETAEKKLLLLRERLQVMEKNQQQMLSFLVMAMQSPGFLVQLLQPKENNWRMAEAEKNMLERGTEDGESVVSDRMMVRYQPQMNETTPKPVRTPTMGLEQMPEYDPASDGIKDLLMNIDFMKALMDENLCSENHAPSDLPDDVVWENIFLAGPFLENIENAKLDNQEPVDPEIEKEQGTKGVRNPVQEILKF